MPPEALAQVVHHLPKSNDPRLIVGTEGFSDAGAFQVSDRQLIIQSLDFFAPLVDDPYVFGQIAAANSLSDVFAMGAEPITALNIVCFPDNKLGMDVLADILRGGTEKVLEAGASILGGHTIRDHEIKYGLSVTGVVAPNELLTNRGARPGDALVLTKALGTGFITTAIKAQKCQPEYERAALDSMLQLNRVASAAARQHRAHAATDITGFGLAVHACELAQSSHVTLVIELNRVPILPGALDCAQRGFTTRAIKTNREFSGSMMAIDSQCNPQMQEILFDPQTSGGLLISVPADRAEDLVSSCKAGGDAVAAIIGRVKAQNEKSLIVN